MSLNRFLECNLKKTKDVTIETDLLTRLVVKQRKWFK